MSTESISASLTSALPVSNVHYVLGDDIGAVELLEVFGDDLTVVNAARVSMGKTCTEFHERDAKLINYLAKHEHVTPFFHPQARFRIKMPIFVAREWYRHQIGFARNEISRRYVDSEVECYCPETTDIRERDASIKQGSKSTSVEQSEEARHIMESIMNNASQSYRELIENYKVAPEVARMVLPQSMYTEFIETGSLAAYARLCHLRQAPDAQKEIRDYANKVAKLLEVKFPVSWAALTVAA